MSTYTDEEIQAAREAAQAAVDTATSWDYSATDTKIADKLQEGFDNAGVTVDEPEFERLVHAIDALKRDEDAGTPTVEAALPKTPA